MENHRSFLRKVRKALALLVCLTVVACSGVLFGSKAHYTEAFAAKDTEVQSETEFYEVAFAQTSSSEDRKLAGYSEVYGKQPIEEAQSFGLMKAGVYKVVEKRETASKEVKYNEISTGAIAQSAMETIEQETLQLMSSPAGTSWGGMIKAYAGKTPILISEEDKEVLLRIVEAEATSEDVKGRMLVANVILNRVLCKGFPNSITEVVFQKTGETYQFSPIKDGRYWTVNVSEKTRIAVERVLAGEDESQGALFFVARRMANENAVRWFDTALEYLFQYGVHEFYKNK